MKSIIQESGYVFGAGQQPFWKRADYAGIDYSDGAEIEQHILDTVRAAQELGSVSPELARKITDWPTLYHFSARRANLLRPFAHFFGAGRRVLEIGSGCGAITRFLGECGGDIVALEGSTVRATITAARCRDLPNVNVIADAVDKFPSRPLFDTVTLIGVLEYARKYFPAQAGGDPVDALLRHAQSLLAPGGVLVVAIENQLGIKYFAGSAEDHVGQSMYGIEDRYTDASPVTFGRQELRERLARAGLAAQDWWLPFPDYKLPTALVAENGLQGAAAQKLGALLEPALENDAQLPQQPTFMPWRALQPVLRNGLGADLANSFLVFAAKSDTALGTSNRTTIAYHLSTERKPEFAASTAFSVDEHGGITISKTPVFPDYSGKATPQLHVQRTITQPFIEGTLWAQALKDILTRDGWTQAELTAWARQWFAALLEHANIPTEKEPLAHDFLLPGNLIDAIPRNLIVAPGGKYVFFDQEWSTQNPVELGFMLYRGIYLSLLSVGRVAPPAAGTHVQCATLFKATALALGFALADADLSRYAALENDFQTLVCGRCHNGDLLAVSLNTRLPLEMHQLAETVRELQTQRDALQTQRDALQTQRDALQTQRDALLASRSWRATAWLRWLGRQARRARNAARYVLRGDWAGLAARVRTLTEEDK